MGFLLSLVELVVIFVVISVIAHPPTLIITLATVCWLLFTTFINGAVGNLRSLMAPKKIDLTKVSRKQASQLSILISLGVVLGCLGIGYTVIVIAGTLDSSWLMVPIFLALALIAFVVYLRVLNRLDAMALDHREDLAEELCKA
jgi:ABC-2 type transport system permease protein